MVTYTQFYINVTILNNCSGSKVKYENYTFNLLRYLMMLWSTVLKSQLRERESMFFSVANIFHPTET